MITVGGDGTLLDAAHGVTRQVIMGVNSTPEGSVGHFSTTTAQGFRAKLKAYLEGRAKIREVYRLQVRIGGKKVGAASFE